MKSVKTLALAGLSILFVACGGNDFVEMKNDRGWNQELYEFGLSELQKKYPDYKLYHYESLKQANFIKAGRAIGVEKKIKKSLAEDEANVTIYPKDKTYNDFIFVYKNDKDYLLVSTTCFINDIGKDKGKKGCRFIETKWLY